MLGTGLVIISLLQGFPLSQQIAQHLHICLLSYFYLGPAPLKHQVNLTLRVVNCTSSGAALCSPLPGQHPLREERGAHPGEVIACLAASTMICPGLCIISSGTCLSSHVSGTSVSFGIG